MKILKNEKKPKLKFKSNTQIYNLRYSKIKKKKSILD